MNYLTKTFGTFTIVTFGELDYNGSTRKHLVWKKSCLFVFKILEVKVIPQDMRLSSMTSNVLDVLKDVDIYNVIEDFVWSGEYKETPEELIECLNTWGYEKIDMSSLKTDEVD